MADQEKQEIEQLVRQIDPGFLTSLNKNQRQQLLVVTSRIVEKTTSFSGPLPPADMLREYSQAVPDGAERIFRMTEEQGQHRRSLEKMVVSGQTKQSERGQLYAFILALVLIGVGTYAIYAKADAVAGVIFGTTIAGLATIFILGKQQQKRSLEAKEKSAK